MNHFVSVVIPAYNRPDLLVQALASVLSQTYRHYEVIVVDDGSTDDTAKVLESYGDRIRYIRQSNGGPSSARNNGIRQAKGDLVAFLDSDDLWLPNKLERQIPVFAARKEIGLVAGAHYVCDDAGSITGSRNAIKEKMTDLAKEIFFRNVFATSTIVARRECFDRAGYFNENYHYGEDWDLWMRIVSKYEFAYLEEPTATYRLLAAQSISGNMKKNYGDWESIIAARTNRSRNPVTRWITYRKAMSWYLFYRSYDERCLKNRRKERGYLLDSVRLWPFFLYKRYLAIGRALVDDRYHELYRKMKGSKA